MDSSLDIYRSVIFMFSILGTMIWSFWGYRHPTNRPISLIPISWLVHVCIFEFFMIFQHDLLSIEQFGLWSLVVRAHCLLLTVAYGFFLVHCTVFIKKDEQGDVQQ